MIIFDGSTYFTFHIAIPKIDDILKFIFKYNSEPLNSMGEKICVRNGIFFYFSDGDKLDIIIYKKVPFD